MKHKANILEIHNPSSWSAPYVNMDEMAYAVRDKDNALKRDFYLHIFQVDPFIDSLLIRYDSERNPQLIVRLPIHEGCIWTKRSEEIFHEYCVKNACCSYEGGMLDQVYKLYNEKHPEWHLKRYLTKGMRLIEHIYNCVIKNSTREMLYKAGLDELAVHIDELDEINLMAGKPSELYEGLTMKVLRSINCPDGTALVKTSHLRAYLKELNQKFPDLFEDPLNDAQCRYMRFLIKGELTVGETGRLFRSRKKDLKYVTSKSMFEIFMARERREIEVTKRSKLYGGIDPIYEDYIRKTEILDDNDVLRQLDYYLGHKREEYDRAIRRSNRKRDPEWEERGEKYYVRYPQTINDFCREAVYMRNCLLTYVDALIKGDTTILFVRKVDDVNTPFITMEIYHNELMQAYHRFNEDCTLEEAGWINEYCKRHGVKTGKFIFDARHDELF